MSTVLSQLQSILDAEQLALLAQVMFEQLGRAATLRARRRFSEAECVQCLSARRRQTAVVSRHACHTVQSGAACAALSVPRPGATGSKAQASLSRCVHSALRSRAFASGDWRIPQQDRPRVSGRFRGRRRLGRLGSGRHGQPRRQRGRGPGRQLGRGTPCDLPRSKGRELLCTPHGSAAPNSPLPMRFSVWCMLHACLAGFMLRFASSTLWLMLHGCVALCMALYGAGGGGAWCMAFEATRLMVGVGGQR